MNADVNDSPAALAGIAVDQTYFVRNKGPDVVMLEIATAAPARDSKSAVPIAAFPDEKCDLYANAESGESIFAWAQRQNGVAVLVFQKAAS